MKKRLIFMGTPQFATAILETLYGLECDVIAVFTQPDRKVGRRQEIQFSPIKQLALNHSTPVYQPESIKTETALIESLHPDLIITCAYGQFIPNSILNLPKFGCVNVHASLLPKYRGGAPIHMAVLNGDTVTGISLMRMISKMDAGNILFQDSIEIHDVDTMGSVHDKLMICGKNLLIKHFNDLFEDNLEEIVQDESKVTYAYNIQPDQEFVSFNRSSRMVMKHIMGLSPWPVAYGVLDGKKVKFFDAQVFPYEGDEKFGTILGLEQQKLMIKCSEGAVLVSELQFEGKKRALAKDVWLGNHQHLLNHVFKETLDEN
jgi:methionyl-tRNA formyltransferase